jgi:hypothetical protein
MTFSILNIEGFLFINYIFYIWILGIAITVEQICQKYYFGSLNFKTAKKFILPEQQQIDKNVLLISLVKT